MRQLRQIAKCYLKVLVWVQQSFWKETYQIATQTQSPLAKDTSYQRHLSVICIPLVNAELPVAMGSVVSIDSHMLHRQVYTLVSVHPSHIHLDRGTIHRLWNCRKFIFPHSFHGYLKGIFTFDESFNQWPPISGCILFLILNFQTTCTITWFTKDVLYIFVFGSLTASLGAFNISCICFLWLQPLVSQTKTSTTELLKHHSVNCLLTSSSLSIVDITNNSICY